MEKKVFPSIAERYIYKRGGPVLRCGERLRAANTYKKNNQDKKKSPKRCVSVVTVDPNAIQTPRRPCEICNSVQKVCVNVMACVCIESAIVE